MMIYIAVWVDDFLIFSHEKNTTQDWKEKLIKKIDMKDLGEMRQ